MKRTFVYDTNKSNSEGGCADDDANVINTTQHTIYMRKERYNFYNKISGKKILYLVERKIVYIALLYHR